TQDDTAAALVAEYGVSVFARYRSDRAMYRRCLDAVLDVPPEIVLDDACDLVMALHTDYADLLPGVRGGCEETTTGVVRLRAMAAHVIVTEVDPGRALDAVLEGYTVLPMAEAARVGEIFVTVSGNCSVIAAEHLKVMRDGALLANAGHFDVEVDVDWLAKNA